LPTCYLEPRAMTSETICIQERFRGPPQSGNGGYVHGVLAGVLARGRFDLPDAGAVEVTLRAPVPLDRELAVQESEQGLRVLDGESLIAEASLTTLRLEVPPPAPWDEVLAARDRSPCLRSGMHPTLGEVRLGAHPICFCCGAELAPDQGLHVYAAPLPVHRQVAAAWTCGTEFALANGELPAEIVCTALDCPGQFAWLAEGAQTGMLGRLTARIERPLRAGEPYRVIGWTMGREGRKYNAGTAIYDRTGLLHAYAKAIWIGRRDA
jgi:hypothetical protein